MKSNSKIVVFLLLIISANAFAQTIADSPNNNYWKFHKGGNWYFSWGYSHWNYPKTDLHFDVNSTDANSKSDHTEYTLKGCTAHDSPFIGKLFVEPLTVPQFCMRVGYFFNADQTFGIELTYDHAKFVVNTDQYVEMKGTTNGVAFDSIAHLYDEGHGAKPFVFKLNNGANFFELNLVKKFSLFESKNGKFKFFYLLKAGGGWNTPHVENDVFGEKNNPHFQFVGGWNVGAEGAIRLLFMNRIYLEFGQKAVFAAYYKLKVANGLASVHLATYGNILSLGINFPGKMNKEQNVNAQ